MSLEKERFTFHDAPTSVYCENPCQVLPNALWKTIKGINNFHIANVGTKSESDLVAEVIKRCYENMNVNPGIVKSWTRHPVFDPNLWIWVIDGEKGTPAGLGIAEFDPTVREGSLEWIQVLPEYRRKGIGKSIVLELLRRLQDRAVFTTVSGEVNNKTRPEILYRRCGFQGDDVWWLLIRKQKGA